MGDVTHTATFKGVSVTAQQDLFEVKGSANAVTFVHGWVISQESEIGDAQEEMLRLTVTRASSTATTGSGGTTLTPSPRLRGSQAFGGTVKANNTTKVTSTSPDQIENGLEVCSWNERVPLVFWYPPESRPVVRPGDFWALELETTPGDALTVNGTLYLEQEGI